MFSIEFEAIRRDYCYNEYLEYFNTQLSVVGISDHGAAPVSVGVYLDLCDAFDRWTEDEST